MQARSLLVAGQGILVFCLSSRAQRNLCLRCGTRVDGDGRVLGHILDQTLLLEVGNGTASKGDLHQERNQTQDALKGHVTNNQSEKPQLRRLVKIQKSRQL